MSCSTYTYHDYAVEYSSTEDLKSWQPVYLDEILSQYTLGIHNGVAALIEDTHRDPLSDDGTGSDTTISSPRTPSFPQMTMDLMENCLMEPLIFMNEEYMPPEISVDYMPTINAIKNGNDSVVLVSASTYGVKNLMFKVSGCILCLDKSDVCVYIPSSLLKKTRDDLIAQNFSCTIKAFKEHNVFYKTKIPSRLIAKSIDIYNSSQLKNTTRSHTPLLIDGFHKYCNINLIVSMSLTPSRSIESLGFDNTPIVQHGRRIIDPIILGIEHQ